MTSTHTTELIIPNLPREALTGHLFPSLGNHSLLSIGQLCDADCNVIFTKSQVLIYFEDSLILQGTRSAQTNNLWLVDLPASQPMAAAAINQSTRPKDLVAFAHASLFSPAITTLELALRKNLITGFPGLTLKSLQAHPPNSLATAKGHLDQARKNQRSTKIPCSQTRR